MGIPGEAGHRFRKKAATDFDRIRPPIPAQVKMVTSRAVMHYFVFNYDIV